MLSAISDSPRAAVLPYWQRLNHIMRVLIVEDEPDLLNGLARALRDEGYAVDTATNGEDGLFNAETNEYDAIVLDVMMPKMDGWEVLSRIRKQRKTPVL